MKSVSQDENAHTNTFSPQRRKDHKAKMQLNRQDAEKAKIIQRVYRASPETFRAENK
jgi:hypothetical protein